MDIRKNKHYEVLQGRLVFNFGKLKVTVGDVVELGQEDIDNGYDIDLTNTEHERQKLVEHFWKERGIA